MGLAECFSFVVRAKREGLARWMDLPPPLLAFVDVGALDQQPIVTLLFKSFHFGVYGGAFVGLDSVTQTHNVIFDGRQQGIQNVALVHVRVPGKQMMHSRA